MSPQRAHIESDHSTAAGSDMTELPESSAMAVLELGHVIHELENHLPTSEVDLAKAAQWLDRVQEQISELSSQIDAQSSRHYGFASPLDYYVVSSAVESLAGESNEIRDVRAITKTYLGAVKSYVAEHKIDELNRVMNFLRKLRDLSFLREDAMRNEPSAFALY